MVLLSATTATGESGRRIAVLQPDDELFRAISLSLAPWGVETARSEAAPPGPSQPDAVRAASRLARELGVDAVVWVSTTERGSLLWVFDARANEVTTRFLAETAPFDGPAAAAVALSVKTVLRESVVAPPDQRFGARPVADSVDRFSALELGGAGHWLGASQPDLRIEIAALFWFAARFGASLEWSTGPGVRVEEALYRGRYRELVLGAKAHFRWIHQPGLSAAASVGGALHWTKLEGKLAASSLDRTVRRLNPSLDIENSVSVDLGGRFYLGASFGASYFPAYRRYLVEGTPILSLWPLGASLGGYCGVELF